MKETRMDRAADFHPRNPLRLALIPIAALALAFGMSACGDDDEETDAPAEEAASAAEVTVTATEYDFELSATPSAETKEVTFDNQGKELHVMIFARINEGFTLDEAIEMMGEKGSATTVAQTEVGPGESKAVKIKKPIEPGEYAMLCPIGGPEGTHYELGQLEEFEID